MSTEGRMNEELHAIVLTVELWTQGTCIADQVATLGRLDITRSQKVVQFLRSREHANSLPVEETMACLCTKGTCLARQAFLKNCVGRHL